MIKSDDLIKESLSLSREVELLKTKKIIFLEKMNNSKINIELKKSRLDLIRKKQFSLGEEYINLQNQIISIREKNKLLEERIVILDNIKSGFLEETEKIDFLNNINDESFVAFDEIITPL